MESFGLNVLLKPLPSTDDDDSPSPPPSELPYYFWNKVAESQKASLSKSPTTPIKELTPWRIPLSGILVKHEPQIPSLGTSVKLEYSMVKHDPDLKSNVKPADKSISLDCESDGEPGKGNQCIEESLQIVYLKPQFTEFIHIFPSFLKTHKNGCTYIIELSNEILNEKALVDPS